MNLKRIRPLLLSLAAVLWFGGDATSQQQPVTEQKAEGKTESSEYELTLTIREIIQAMVVPQSEALWAAVSTTVTARGTTYNYPKTEEGWTKLRHQAVQLAEASNLIIMPGRHVAKPGEKAQDPRSQLAPEAVEELVKGNRADWVKFSREMYERSVAVIAAIDARNPEALTTASDRLTITCEACHRRFWYPRQGYDSRRFR